MHLQIQKDVHPPRWSFYRSASPANTTSKLPIICTLSTVIDGQSSNRQQQYALHEPEDRGGSVANLTDLNDSGLADRHWP